MGTSFSGPLDVQLIDLEYYFLFTTRLFSRHGALPRPPLGPKGPRPQAVILKRKMGVWGHRPQMGLGYRPKIRYTAVYREFTKPMLSYRIQAVPSCPDPDYCRTAISWSKAANSLRNFANSASFCLTS